MFNDGLKVKGSFGASLIKSNGDIETRRKDNLILDVGFDFIADAIGSQLRPDAMGYTAVGTGADAADAAQTQLVAELTRKAAAYVHAPDSKVFTLTTTFDAGEATGAITEAGIVNASIGGIFLDRVTFAVINKGADDVLTTTFQFTLS